MKLSSLPKLVTPSKKRVGRGHGSGLGKTAGRGTKGQKARERIQTSFEGGQLRLIKRLPFRRGVGNTAGSETLAVNLSELSRLPKGAIVNIDSLVAAGIISSGEAKKRKIKVLGGGELKVALKVELQVSSSAAKKITDAGGQVVGSTSSPQVGLTKINHTLSGKDESKGVTISQSSN